MKHIALFALVVSLCSCATILKGQNETVNIASNPDGAEVFVDGQYMGKAPVQLVLASKNTHSVEFRKPGHESKTVFLNNNVNGGYIVLDILFGLVPIIVDAGTGSWHVLDQHNINGALLPERTVSSQNQPQIAQ
jgi:hypothetical protein